MLISHHAFKFVSKTENLKSILHIGAHEAEELDLYEAAGSEHVVWVECNPMLAKKLLTTLHPLRNTVVQGCVSDFTGKKVDFYLADNSESSSLLQPIEGFDHMPTFSAKISVETSIVDSIVPDKQYDLCVLDIQGAELRALRGMTKTLGLTKMVYTEVQKTRLYRDSCLIDEVDEFLGRQGFRRYVTKWTKNGWGEALYLRGCKFRTAVLLTLIHLVSEVWISLRPPWARMQSLPSR